jgi:hypothetical protein
MLMPFGNGVESFATVFFQVLVQVLYHVRLAKSLVQLTGLIGTHFISMGSG